jgi:hypothetical protein
MDQMSLSKLHFECFRRTAVCLNNNAVALLVKGCVREAVDTLKDSIKLMNCASEARDSSILSSEVLQEVKVKINTALQLAQRRFSASSSGDSSLPQVYVIRPCSSQTDPYAMICNKNFSHIIPIPILIDQLPIDEYDDDDFDLECAFVLYNFGLSQMVLTNTYLQKSDQSTKRTAQQNSLQVLQLGYSLFSKIRGHAMQSILLGLLLTRSLIHGSMVLNQSSQKYHQAIQQLLDFVEEHHVFFPAGSDLRGAPAA